jgi:hypothetical protein
VFRRERKVNRKHGRVCTKIVKHDVHTVRLSVCFFDILINQIRFISMIDVRFDD